MPIALQHASGLRGLALSSLSGQQFIQALQRFQLSTFAASLRVHVSQLPAPDAAADAVRLVHRVDFSSARSLGQPRRIKIPRRCTAAALGIQSKCTACLPRLTREDVRPTRKRGNIMPKESKPTKKDSRDPRKKIE